MDLEQMVNTLAMERIARIPLHWLQPKLEELAKMAEKKLRRLDDHQGPGWVNVDRNAVIIDFDNHTYRLQFLPHWTDKEKLELRKSWGPAKRQSYSVSINTADMRDDDVIAWIIRFAEEHIDKVWR